jgi:hypothetical protein
MDLQLPDPNDPIWTTANGFLVRQDEGPLKLLNGGVEQARVKVSGDRTGGRLSLLEMYVAPGFGNIAHAHGDEDEAFYIRPASSVSSTDRERSTPVRATSSTSPAGRATPSRI